MWGAQEGRGYTKRGLNSSTCLEVDRPIKNTPTLCPWKGRNSLGSVNSKVGTWAPACSLLIQEAQPNCPRLAFLPSKSCSYCSGDRRYFKTLFWGQTIFTSHEVKQLLNGRGHLLISYQRILRYQVVLMENPGLTISLFEVLNPATHLPNSEVSLPFHSCLETWDYWTKPQEGLSGEPLTNPGVIWYTDGNSFVLNGKRIAGYAVVSNFETIEAKLLPQVLQPNWLSS